MPVTVTVDDLHNAGVQIGAQHYLASVSPYSIMTLDSFEYSPIRDLAGTGDDNEERILTLNFAYAYPSEFNNNGERWRYNFKTELSKITAVKTSDDVQHIGPDDPDTGLAIGIDGDTVNGVSVYRPASSLTVEKIFTARPSNDYLETIRDIQGTTNNGQWDAFRLGEALFLGASFERQNDGKWVGTYNFNIQPDKPAESLEFSDGVLRSIPAAPHDYVAVRFAKGNTGVPSRNIKDAHVYTVYNSSNFDQLGLIGDYE
jgi:hypothetical protein